MNHEVGGFRLQAPQPLEVLPVEDGDQRGSVTVEELTEAVFTLCLGTEKRWRGIYTNFARDFYRTSIRMSRLPSCAC